eukprot:scaffold86_cov338-Pavlova_lutheri.AAC.2
MHAPQKLHAMASPSLRFAFAILLRAFFKTNCVRLLHRLRESILSICILTIRAYVIDNKLGPSVWDNLVHAVSDPHERHVVGGAGTLVEGRWAVSIGNAKTNSGYNRKRFKYCALARLSRGWSPRILRKLTILLSRAT